MKKFVLGAMCLLAFTVTSCGPSICDCLKAEANNDSSIKEACNEKYKNLDPSEINDAAKGC